MKRANLKRLGDRELDIMQALWGLKSFGFMHAAVILLSESTTTCARNFSALTLQRSGTLNF